jgi:ATP-dependent RNA helicase DDX42
MKTVKLSVPKPPRGGTLDVFKQSKHASLLSVPAPAPVPAPAESLDDSLDAFLAELSNADTSQRAAKAATTSSEELLEASEAGEGYVPHLDAAFDEDKDDVGEDGALVFDDDGNVIGVSRSTAESKAGIEIAPLPAIDHSAVNYAPFVRCFYAPVSEVAAMTARQIADARSELGISVIDGDGVAPVQSFMQLCLDATYPALISALAQAGFEAPTGIQSQALPALLSGRDVIGIAHTGSGKTLAYALPIIRHCVAQPSLQKHDGPIAVVLAPTRELSAQIAVEVRRFAKAVGLQVALLSGGSSQWEQTLALRAGAEIVVATPGRLIEHVKSKTTNLQRVTFLVIDEADR